MLRSSLGTGSGNKRHRPLNLCLEKHWSDLGGLGPTQGLVLSVFYQLDVSESLDSAHGKH